MATASGDVTVSDAVGIGIGSVAWLLSGWIGRTLATTGFADAGFVVGATKDDLIVGIGEILAVGEIVAVGLIVGGGVGVGGRVGDAVAVGAGVGVDGGAVAGGGDGVARGVGVGAVVGEADAVPVGDGEGDAATSTIAMNELSSSAAGQIVSAPARATDLNRASGRRAAGPFRRTGTRFSGRALNQIPAMGQPLVLVPGCNDPPVVTQPSLSRRL